MKHIELIAVLIAVATIAAPPDTHAQLQWEKVYTFPARPNVIYFYSPSLGFAGIGMPPGGNAMVVSAIYRTTDGGYSWALTNSPHAEGNGINDIRMTDSLNGWATGDNSAGKIWKTTDGGLTWEATIVAGSSPGLGNAVCQVGNNILMTDFTNGTIERSEDHGLSFTIVNYPSPWDYCLGMDFVDSLHGAAITSFRTSNPWSYTNDGGKSWHPSNYTMESWTVKGMKGTSMFFAAPEGYSDGFDYLTAVMRSTNYGKSWDTVAALPFRASSDMEISGHTLFIQTGDVGCYNCTYPEGEGIYRSTDSGRTWHGLGGPSDWGDTRFGITQACNGMVIVCSDIHNSIYRALDTEFDLARAPYGPEHTTLTAPAEIRSSGCETGSAEIDIQTSPCYSLVVTGLTLSGGDSSRFYLQTESLPFTVQDSLRKIFVYVLNPVSRGEYKSFVHIVGYYDYGQNGKQPLDTLIPISALISRKAGMLAAIPEALVFDARTRCSQPHDETLTLSNVGCDSVVINTPPEGIVAPFSIDSMMLPIILRPGQSIRLSIHIDTSITTLHDTAYAIFKWMSDSLEQLTVVPLVVRKPLFSADLEIVPKDIRFRAITTCDSSATMTTTIKNTGCDTVTIVSDAMTSSPEFEFDMPTLPRILAPGASVTCTAIFTPRKPGNYFTDIYVLSESDGYDRVDTIALIGTVSPLGPQLSLSASDITFPLLSVCEAPVDTTIVMTNESCDSIEIVSATLSSSNVFRIDPMIYPLTLPPSGVLVQRIHFHPDSSGGFDATETIVADRFGARGTYSISMSGSGHWGNASMEVASSTMLFPTMSVCDSSRTQQTFLTNSGCEVLSVDSITHSDGVEVLTGLERFPVLVSPADTFRFAVRCSPHQKGTWARNAVVSAHSRHDAATEFIDTISLFGNTVDGSRVLIAGSYSIDLGSSTICTTKDTSVTIYNAGCDTLVISQMKIGNGFTLIDTSLPLVLAPGSSSQVFITTVTDTVGEKKESVATLSFVSNSDIPMDAIMVRRGYIYPKHTTLSVTNAAYHAFAGDTIELLLHTESPLEGISSIGMDMQFDSDLLTVVKVIGNGNVTYRDHHLTILDTGYSDTIVSIYVVASLAKALTTNIVFSNIIFSVIGEQGECSPELSLGDSQSTVVIDLRCGDETIRSALRGEIPFVMGDVYPNPANSSCSFTIKTSAHAMVNYRILNSTGICEYAGSAEYLGSSEPITVDTRSLASGVHVIECFSEGYVERRLLIVER